MNSQQHDRGSLPVPSSNIPSNDTVVSIVRHSKNQTIADDELQAVVEYSSPLGGYEVPRNYEPPDKPPEKLGLEQLLTPWGIGSLLILLFANLLACWANWEGETGANNTISQSKQTSQDVSLSQPVNNFPPSNSENLTLLQLSLVSVSSPSAKTAAQRTGTEAQLPKKANTKAQSPQRANNLTNALLPPSLQPSLMQTYPEPVAPKPSLSQVLPLTSPSQPQGVPRSIQPAPVPSPSVSQNPDKKATEIQLMLEEQRRREASQTPLGFNHRTRSELRSATNKEDPSQLIEQMQQLQQQKIDEAASANPQPTINKTGQEAADKK